VRGVIGAPEICYRIEQHCGYLRIRQRHLGDSRRIVGDEKGADLPQGGAFAETRMGGWNDFAERTVCTGRTA
jgi:hypothetical protein